MYIYLDFIEKFNCAMCGTCCRNDWMVTVDEASFQRNAEWFYRQGRQAEFSQAFTLLSQPGQPGEYASIAKKPTGGCWFLQDDNACFLHRQAGHGHLDAVCQTFPRYPMDTSRGWELTLSFSCPAVLKLVRRVAPLTIVRREELPLSVPDGESVAAVYPKQRQMTNALRYYYELEQHFIDVLQCRQLPLEERIRLLAQTVLELNSPGQEDMAQCIDGQVRRNYAVMDEASGTATGDGFTAEVLAEHFLVNFVFKKTFYIHGLQLGMDLLGLFFQDIRQAVGPGRDEEEKLHRAEQAIMRLEFEYGHNRGALLRGKRSAKT